MERILRQHFDAESPDLRSPTDPWPWVESRMEEPGLPPFFSRLVGALTPLRGFRLSPALAGAGVAVVAVAVVATVWAISGNGGPATPGEMASVPATQAPGTGSGQMAPTPVATEPPLEEQPDTSPRQGIPSPSGHESTQASDSAASPDDPVPTRSPEIAPAESQATVPTQLPVPTSAPQQAMEEESVMMMEEPQSEGEMVAVAQEAGQPSIQPTQAAATESGVQSFQRHATPAPRATRAPNAANALQGAAGTAPSATTFRDYQRQQFVAASEDNVSTFSLDTDRTSFQLALNWARSGYEVNPDSVRAEEWLNAFNYDYDPPSNSSSFAVTSDLLPHPLDEDKRLARIAFQAPELADDKPVNVTLVLDASGSMGDGNRVDIARRAAESIRQGLSLNDRIAVVQFTGSVLHQYTVEHTHPNDGRIASSIAWLQPHGSTNVQAGLNLGVSMADEVRDRRPNAYNYVILMSDGVANVDATDPFAILETAYDPDDGNPLRLITIGVGIENYNDLLLEQLAQHGNGWYRYLDTPEQAQATFTRENWLALSTPFADQTRAQVTWNTDAVERWRIIGYENRVTADENFTQDRKEFAEIYSGAATTVFYELELSGTAKSSANVGLGTVELRWVDPGTGDARGQTVTLRGNPGADPGGEDGALAQFGAVVALAADLYGAVTTTTDDASVDIHSGLSSLKSQVEELDADLGSLDSYRDFKFLLEHIIRGLEERLPPSTPSGYSP